MRTEVRNFLVDPMLRTVETRAVDTEDPGALYPIGMTITCDAGHEVCELRESLHLWQQITANSFGSLRAGQPPIPLNSNRLVCYCGRPYFAFGRLHSKYGWGRGPNSKKHPWTRPVVKEQPPIRRFLNRWNRLADVR